MQNQKPEREPLSARDENVSMSDEDREKTVANPSPGSSDPGNEDRRQQRSTSGRTH